MWQQTSRDVSTQSAGKRFAAALGSAGLRPRNALARAFIVSLALAAGSAPPAFSADSDPMMLNLKDADIRAFIESMSELTGKNFVIDPRVQGKVTVISAMPTDPRTLYDVFVSILKVHGFTAVDTGDVVKIIPDVVAKTQGGDIPDQRGGYLGEEPVTRVIQLQNVTAAELVPVLQPLLPPEAHIAAHNSSNAIVVSDSQANVARIAQIVNRIDRKVERDVEVIRLMQANAAEMARILNATRPQTPDPTTGQVPIAVVADERTNSLIVGGNRETRLQLRTLISHLDTPMNVQSGVEVIYLRNAVAKDIVETLKGIGTKLDAQASASAGGAAAAAAPAATGGTSVSSGSDARKLEVFADEATNAIIMQGSPERIREMKSIIQALDIRRAQVHVAGIIAEVSEGKAAELGIQWRTDTPNSGGIGGIIFPGTEAGNIQSLTADAATLGTGLSLGLLQTSTVRALLRALASDSTTNVLSTPTLVTMDNEEAEITVGQNVPFITGQYTSTGTGQGVSNPFQTVERKDVGVLLKVKPQINEGNAVKLTIEQEVSSVASATTGVDLITNKRAIKTNVLVEDGQIIVIGGLIQDDVRQSTQKVPLLGDIPLIGNAFRNRRSDVTKTNLMVFLQPTIIRDVLTANTLTMGKYNFIRDRQAVEPWNRAQLLPQVETPKLPVYSPPALKEGELPPPVQNYRRDQFLNSPAVPATQGRELQLSTPPTGATTPPANARPAPVTTAPASTPARQLLGESESMGKTYAAVVDPTAPLSDATTVRSELRAAEAAAGIDGDYPDDLPPMPAPAATEPARVPGFVRDGLR
jgi:general secretion pathway protein D